MMTPVQEGTGSKALPRKQPTDKWDGYKPSFLNISPLLPTGHQHNLAVIGFSKQHFLVLPSLSMKSNSLLSCAPLLDSDPLELVENGIGVQNGGAVSQKLMEARLTETFGEEGKVNMENLIRQHNERLSEVSSKYREELAEQQQTYLLQIKDCRDEIQALKSALRHEQQKSRRLQALLRGDP